MHWLMHKIALISCTFARVQISVAKGKVFSHVQIKLKNRKFKIVLVEINHP